MNYEAAKQIAHHGAVAERRKLAGQDDARPELLYYMAVDADTEVRRAVAANPTTPVQASPILVKDKEPVVRSALAVKLARLLPNLPPEKHQHLFDIALDSIKKLAEDQVMEVRRALATALSDIACVPPQIANKLARDAERKVAEPVLRFCDGLSDRDLLEILASQPQAWVARAIASRESVAARVSGGVIDKKDTPANVTLIDNEGAIIDEKDLGRLVDQVSDVPEIGEALNRRKLPSSIAKRLRGQIEAAVRNTLSHDKALDRALREEVSDTVTRRMEMKLDAEEEDETPYARAKRLHRAGMLDDQAVRDAIAIRDYPFCYAALGRLSHIPSIVAQKVIESGSPKAITALCWRAGLAMRTAMEMQKGPGHVSPKLVLNARGGEHYPITPASMNWQLEFFGIEDPDKVNEQDDEFEEAADASELESEDSPSPQQPDSQTADNKTKPEATPLVPLDDPPQNTENTKPLADQLPDNGKKAKALPPPKS